MLNTSIISKGKANLYMDQHLLGYFQGATVIIHIFEFHNLFIWHL